MLEELGLPYETKIWQFSEMKQEPFVKINPNGRVPAIEDPNTGITLWEVLHPPPLSPPSIPPLPHPSVHLSCQEWLRFRNLDV